MSENVLLKRTVVFRRMDSKAVEGYKIYAMIPDESYSGFRQDLLDEIINPNTPDVIMSKIPLDYNKNLTWKTPNDIYMDIDHPFNLYINKFIISPIMYEYNKITKLITINDKLIKINSDDSIELEYYKDVITKTYLIGDDYKITIVPVYKKEVTIGRHNIIV